ncbi:MULTISPECIES: hypothetical protein [unclassified Caballeronia]|nr:MULTISPECIES: hypothetical protein [unclassified Caballeronia]MDR5804309.1 hypothetical protein [Caballeronia sp. LZ001]
MTGIVMDAFARQHLRRADLNWNASGAKGLSPIVEIDQQAMAEQMPHP